MAHTHAIELFAVFWNSDVIGYCDFFYCALTFSNKTEEQNIKCLALKLRKPGSSYSTPGCTHSTASKSGHCNAVCTSMSAGSLITQSERQLSKLQNMSYTDSMKFLLSNEPECIRSLLGTWMELEVMCEVNKLDPRR